MTFPPNRRRALQAGGALAAASAFPSLLLGNAHAQSAWPTKSVRLIVPFAPGGSSEIVARSAASELTKTLGQSVFVDNKPGAGGNIAMQECAASTDGHTLILGHIGTMAVNPFIYDKLPFDTNRDFQPISLLAKVPSLYVVNANVPAKNLQEFIALARAKPGQLNYGSAGNGSAGHLAFEYLKMATNTFVLHVPYRGTGPQLTDLLAGRLDAAAVGAPAILAHIKSGKLRCIATGTKERLPQLPDVPTVAESGFPGFEMTQWYGLNAPASMSQAAIDKIAEACGKAMRNPLATERLRGDTAQPVGDSPAQYGAFIAAEQARWKKVIARAKIHPD
ncbi:ABC transporter substrate-binding protein [Acidovorax sp. SRB_14]|uniref:Bug family tripartite tricarboxylate transporter substrate binding protein n=1 Tax=unclassified Acidovorax TaxID=2684926 RepID=UPI00145D1E1E|nr:MULTISPECIES: tripartite tricarboxylate transporter substrate binding protein [unclassified Acidovorax]NMM78058.1 ABC transporter substrate-binding protein [Acidovorax sp. SRB_24]NMM82502.1 ABC transporter substrate-binding protein [Acidovorax sp. SRB_14]NMM91029.1 ABC transporter substrate-binding protein [Rhodococcus sp. SRB_17]